MQTWYTCTGGLYSNIAMLASHSLQCLTLQLARNISGRQWLVPGGPVPDMHA